MIGLTDMPLGNTSVPAADHYGEGIDLGVAIGNEAIGDLTAGLQRGGIDADLKDKVLIKFGK